VNVDEARRHIQAIRFDLVVAARRDATGLDDSPARDGHIRPPRRAAAAVDYGPAPNDEIQAHEAPSRSRRVASRSTVRLPGSMNTP
jgi:hypothetical protein